MDKKITWDSACDFASKHRIDIEDIDYAFNVFLDNGGYELQDFSRFAKDFLKKKYPNKYEGAL